MKTNTNNNKNLNNVLMMDVDGQITTHRQTIAEKCNDYYVSVADNITNNNPINNTNDDLNEINPLNYLYYMFKRPFADFKIQLLKK
jgi:hypothetical protein